MTTVVEDRDFWNRRATELAESVATLTTERDGLTARIKDLEQQLEKTSVALWALRGEVGGDYARQRDRITELERQIVALGHGIEALSRERDAALEIQSSYEKFAECLESDLQAAQRRAHNLKQTLDDVGSTLLRLQMRVLELEKERESG